MKKCVQVMGIAILGGASVLLSGCSVVSVLSTQPTPPEEVPMHEPAYTYETEIGPTSRPRYNRVPRAPRRTGGRYHSGAIRPVNIPSTYHIQDGQLSGKRKSREVNWVKSQNPDNYTIEINHGKSAASVAKALHVSPKDRRKAHLKLNGDKKTYTGVYGSYKNREEAQKALQNLPESVRAKAKVNRWKRIQSNVGGSEESARPVPVAAPKNDENN